MRNTNNFVNDCPSEQEVVAALGYLDASCTRDYWVRIGMAIKSEFGESGFQIWHEWSQSGDSYSKASCVSTWRSIKKSGSGKSVSISTLFSEAANNGWKPENKVLSDREKEALRDKAEKRKLLRDAEERKEALMAESWRVVYREALEGIWLTLLQPFTRSGYVNRKGIRGRTLASPLQPFVMVTDLQEIRVDVITDKRMIKHVFESDEYADKSRYSKRYIRPGSVLIPLRDLDGRIYNAQVIQETGRKMFFKNAPVSGLFHVIGEPINGGIIAESEGYATAETINMATGWPVFVAFFASNLLPVSKKIKKQYPSSNLVVCGDDDAETKENAGREAAMRVVKETGATCVFPNFKRQIS